MNERYTKVCKAFVGDSKKSIPMVSSVKVSENASYEKVRAIGEEEIIGMFQSGKTYKITMKLLEKTALFDSISNFDLTVNYSDRLEKYSSCFVEYNQIQMDDSKLFIKQTVVIAGCGRRVENG